MSLRYPQELNQTDTDYVIFQAQEYRTNASGESGPPAGPPIILYMPTSTPSVAQANDWGAKNFDGPLGALTRDFASSAAGHIMTGDISSVEAAKNTGKAIIDDIKSGFENVKKSGGGALRQMGVNAVAGLAQMSPNQLMAMSRGEIFNPNIELLYQGPKVRGFSFNYTFVPKSLIEAQMVNKIIMDFKRWSAPKLNEGTGMYKIPMIWQVTYMSGSGVNKNMNKFKRAALTNVAHQSNSGLNMHMSFADGMPIVTSISLQFTEVDVITRDDHDKSGTNVGY